jgi:hypothetical protein
MLTWNGHVDAERFRAGDAARATLDAGGLGLSRHVQHHHPPRGVLRALGAAGLRAVAVHGMDLTGTLATPVDETVHTKALFTCVGTR